MSAPTRMTLAQARDALAAKKISARELTEAHLTAVEAARPLNAYTVETPEKALAMADASDARLAKGEAGPLEGIPLAIKDLFCTEGVESTAGSHILKDFKPAYESTVTANLWRDGAVMLGKVNMDEFAMGSSNMTSTYGGVVNPWRRNGSDEKLVPGGSSGGSAAAVAARCALGATGTDTGGSIRQPASFSGVVGLKPTYGRCSRWGIIAFASSLDQAGPMARSVRDCAILLRSMAGFDAKDSTSVDVAVPDFEQALTGDVRGLKVGIPKEYRVDGMPAEIDSLWQQGIDWLKAAGAEPVEISLPHTKYALPTYYIVAPAEASSNLARYDGVRYGLRVEGETLDEMYEATRGAGFGDEVKRRILIGTYVLSAGYYDAYYNKARQVRTLIARDFKAAYETVDVILTPTAPSAAFAMGANMDDPVAMYLNDVFTVPASLAGLPGISVPAGLSMDGLPLGLQLIGRAFDEETLVRTAGVLEEAAAFTAEPAFIAGD
ncbi:Asp-tRNA(Asn)/Glu-tRNA(Gln) amidotransferase subunit GatA [Aquibaculum arenosum]|uniref:Glutamyl-tRNA(Gln) amidotransferase subunit A n=1 Tax=Aquibaculum arenosum TaxID=3032591 RepID=A0ABT5YJT9_9PROT|nr:Asp-tRNA(Asn)/Glu-tRNA(Gln) amidotransferase subunit GatA [Fodinicurvata sp. CAU 1616]MDF2095118.1 Asp-tRNA(Asn)/Glu-tRNA(Gln) amidotransferase subunit GatA [Fodinicurvata sp. CAU 1616]